jgi:arsenate reductase-like glutaredoxin family protein
MDANHIQVLETVPASRKLGKKEATSIAKAASRIIVCKGKKVHEWKPGGQVSAEIVAAMLGPTGNLRAPTIQVGKTIVVGFHDEAYQEILG